MKLFPALVHKDEGSAFGMIFPDVRGCFAAADDADSLIENGAEALALWFEDQAPVEPRALEAVRAEVVDALREGAFFVVVPFVGGRGSSSARTSALTWSPCGRSTRRHGR